MRHLIILLFLLPILSVGQQEVIALDDNLNLTSSTTFNLKGEVIGAQVNYYNVLGKPIQSQFKDVLTGKNWASSLIYKADNKLLLNTLFAPINQSQNFSFKPSLITTVNGTAYTENSIDFTTGIPAPVGGQPNSLGAYYTSSNTSRDITSRPFTYSIYSRYLPNRAKHTILGDPLDTNLNNVADNINESYPQGFSYTLPAAQELYYAFGKSFFKENSNAHLIDKLMPNLATNTPNFKAKATRLDASGDLTNFKVDIQFFHEFKDHLQGLVYLLNDGDHYILENVQPINQVQANISKVDLIRGPYFHGSLFLDFSVLSENIKKDPNKHLISHKSLKTVVIDEKGNEAVVWKDIEGKIIAAAKSGGDNKYEVVSHTTKGYVDIHLPVNTTRDDVELEGDISKWTFLNLRTEQYENVNNITGGNIYRAFYNDTDTEYKFEEFFANYIDQNGKIKKGVTPFSDTQQIRYKVNYYDFTLNYYNDAGQLTHSTQPLGFDDTNLLAGTPNNTPKHYHISTVKTNSLGELIESDSPDEGKAQFKYRKDGQIRYSQNEKQKALNQVSYTNYDNLARPIESGVLQAVTVAEFNALNPDATLPNKTKQEVTKTVYGHTAAINTQTTLNAALSASNIPTASYQQKYLSGSSVAYTEAVNSKTWYSYDIYGRVTWLVQDIAGVGAKTIHYNYDPIQGNVVAVIYQKDVSTEYLQHKYKYNLVGQLENVETSTDGIVFKPNASYTYNEQGQLTRKILGENLQGIDYVYNINGQLKSINHPSLTRTQDPGGDNNDVFGMLIHYNHKDYAKNPALTSNLGTNQYNGNIKGVEWGQLGNTDKSNYYYSYDRHNWLTKAQFNLKATALDNHLIVKEPVSNGKSEAVLSVTLKSGFHAPQGVNHLVRVQPGGGTDYLVDNIKYDANGNILSLRRNKDTDANGNSMDDLDYGYVAGTNQLGVVGDNVTRATGVDDIKGDNYYTYNDIGQLTQSRDNTDAITEYTYTTSGLVDSVKKGSVTISFGYNERGQRISKTESNGSLESTTYYVRDATGSTLAVYGKTTNSQLQLIEQTVYGGSRLGILKRKDASKAGSKDKYLYQITDHLGSVRAVVTKSSTGTAAVVTNKTDYYPFGMPMPKANATNVQSEYRYAFQGQEKDPETGKEAFQLRLWDARIGRWLTTDPYRQYASPYLGMGNDPINGIDPDGGYRTWIGAVGGWIASGFTGSIKRHGLGGNKNYAIENTTYNSEGPGVNFNINYGDDIQQQMRDGASGINSSVMSATQPARDWSQGLSDGVTEHGKLMTLISQAAHERMAPIKEAYEMGLGGSGLTPTALSTTIQKGIPRVRKLMDVGHKTLWGENSKKLYRTGIQIENELGKYRIQIHKHWIPIKGMEGLKSGTKIPHVNYGPNGETHYLLGKYRHNGSRFFK